MGLSRLREDHNSEFNDFLQFKRKTTDDLQRVWDSVNELAEISNVTTKHLEELYDKDLLKLQNFQSYAENMLQRLDEDVDLALGGGHRRQVNGGQFDAVARKNNVTSFDFEAAKRLNDLESDVRKMHSDVASTQAIGKDTRDDLQRVFEDVDQLKSDVQDAAQDRLVIKVCRGVVANK